MIKTAKELANACERIAKNNKTLYVLGCIGSPMCDGNKARYTKNLSYNKRHDRRAKINGASADTFGFDCVCLIKALLWGWEGNTDKVYGGATYASNGVPDIDANAMIRKCSGVSTDFSHISVGEAVWMQDHIGVYIGGGLAVECTPKWADGVQITAVHNIGTKSGYNGRKWVKHGKLPYVTYEAEPAPTPDKDVNEVAREVIAGKWGSGSDRKNRLEAAGYDYNAVQSEVNQILSGPKKSIDTVAREVIAGKWGSGATRKSKLIKAGYDYNAVQRRVNELLR